MNTTSKATESFSRKPDPRLLDELVKRTVEAVHPLRIILFGSAARDAMGPDSDLDLLVADGVHRRRTAQTIYRSLRGLCLAKDVVVVTESDILEYRDNPSLVINPALRYGKELYNAAR